MLFYDTKRAAKLAAPRFRFFEKIMDLLPKKGIQGAYISGTDGRKILLARQVGTAQFEYGLDTRHGIVDLCIQHTICRYVANSKCGFPQIGVAPAIVDIEPKVLEPVSYTHLRAHE